MQNKAEIKKSKIVKPNWKIGIEKPINLKGKDLQLVRNYLEDIARTSKTSQIARKCAILDLLEHLEKPILDIRKIDVYNYLKNRLDSKTKSNGNEITTSTKKTYHALLVSFFDYIETILLDDNIDFSNPVPRKFKFTTKETDIKKQAEKTSKLLSKQEIAKILDYCKRNYFSTGAIHKQKYFIYFALLSCTGARLRELATVRISDVNLQERYFETGFVMSARKSTHHTEESLVFCFPENLVPYLENYIFKLKKRCCEWLFPSGRNIEKYWSPKGIARRYEYLRTKLSIHFTPHYFRHSIITYLKQNGASREDREFLMNHIPSGIQGRVYEHDDLETRIKLYDKHFPYTNLVPYF